MYSQVFLIVLGVPWVRGSPENPITQKKVTIKEQHFASSKKKLLNPHLLWVLDLQGNQPGLIHPVENNDKNTIQQFAEMATYSQLI